MSDENDSWLKTTLGIDVPSFLGGATNDASVGSNGAASPGASDQAPAAGGGPPPSPPTAAPAPFVPVEEKLPAIPGVSVFEQVEVEGEPGNDGANEGQQNGSGEQGGGGSTPTSGPAVTATIAVKANGDGSFTITGSGFTQRLVSVRAVDDFLGERWFPTESKDGKIAVKTPKICVQEGAIHFSVLAGTHPLVSDLLSNIAHSTCGPQKAPEKKDDEPEPSPEDDQTEKIHAGLRTVYGWKVKYWILDKTSGKMLVDGVEYEGGKEIWFDCDCTGQPDTGRVHYQRASDESGGGRTQGGITLVSRDKVTNMHD